MKNYGEYKQMVEDRLRKLLADEAEERPVLLNESMSYSVFAGGKRLRPVMLLAAVEMLGADAEDALDFACAIEMIHTYSLIHDDLPGMDNDDMRRGRPTSHVVYGEGQAILAGDALLSYAMEIMLNAAIRLLPAPGGLYAAAEIARGAGVTGMVAGQCLDLQMEGKDVSESMLYTIQHGKTACMFLYPLRAAGRLAGAQPQKMCRLTAFGEAFGHLFQATDDLLDVIGSSEVVGKSLGKDAQEDKLTCIKVYGVEGTREHVRRRLQDALEALDGLAKMDCDTRFFADLATQMVAREA